MTPSEAAKVLRRHNEWRRGADDNHWQQAPYSPAELGHAIDAAVAALESVDCDTPPPADEIPTIEQMREILNGHPRERDLAQDAMK